MAIAKLIIGNKNYSSWSMRPWLGLKAKGVQFEEQLSGFDHATNSAHFWDFSPTKKVPVLVYDGMTIWDSLAILEFAAELYPDKGFWPTDQMQRAHARALASEMHSGFAALRSECPMNMHRTPSAIAVSDDVRADITRIETIWADCLQRYGGPFLFGEFTIADAMFAPVVNRIEIYQLSDTPAVRQYSEAIRGLPAWQQWDAEGKAETWVSELMEV